MGEPLIIKSGDRYQLERAIMCENTLTLTRLKK